MMQGCSNKYPDLQSKSAYIARLLTKIGQASMNQALMREGDKSTQGFTFQTCSKNLIPCIPRPKTSRVELN
ncbi:hypothetical protein IGI04_019589 [Brassica rapa subsp. trilocularis]|uniref:Uncharacterized protein n=1 Tax=Brassica rapa subsp. trilocularis TaxID=1813537 RepID=A0ABQ7MH54_BRACM|nr:hypothetical protein IGI04_019589 [Brassica rapa subsp. trilocularis]